MAVASNLLYIMTRLWEMRATTEYGILDNIYTTRVVQPKVPGSEICGNDSLIGGSIPYGLEK